MSSFRSVILAGGLAALAQAFTTPTTASWGPLLKPDLSNAVTQGQTFQVTWDPESHPTDGVTISLVLCHGPSSNCQTASNAIVEGVPAAQKSYSWSVPCDLAAGTASTETGYGMLIIVDGTGEFQYSTQFSVLAGSSCGSSSSSSANSTSSTSASLLHAGGWTTAANGQSTYVSAGAWNTTTTGPSASTASLTISAPSSIVYATNSAAPGTVTSAVAGTTSYAVASPTAPAASASASAFAGAAAKVNGQVTGVLGFVAGALAMLAL